MASKVWYARFDGQVTEQWVSGALKKLFQAADLAGTIVPDAATAVKTHFGEEGNKSYVPPAFVKAVVEEVREAGGKPCLVETSTLYRGQRANAIDHFNLAVVHGFGPQAMGCPLLFLDGLRGNLHVERQVGLKHFDTVAVAGDFTLMPSAVIVTHVTGHLLAAFGGAIKNVAMGLSSRAGKLRQHAASKPRVDARRCTACGTCAEWCPQDAIAVERAAHIDQQLCIGCGECAAVCPEGAVQIAWDETARGFNEKMAEYAYGILKDKLDHVSFVSFIYRTTPDCNCMPDKGNYICPDLGILTARDAVAIDKAAVDLINKAHGGDLFERVRPGAHYEVQFAHGEEIGLGSRTYELVTV
jgi:hypothetical protein